MPAGKHRVEIAHTGADWVNLKSVRLERLRPAAFAGAWQFATEAIGLRSADTVVAYVRSPYVAWPAGALRFNPPVIHGAAVTLKDWPSGSGKVVWLDPKNGKEISTASVSGKGNLFLPVPDFSEEVVAIITK